MFGRSTLVRVHHVFVTQYIFHSVRELVERHTARVGVIGSQHSGELVIAHCVDATVGEHVQEYVLRFEQEGVVTCFGHRLDSFLDGDQSDLLHHTRLVHLNRYLFARRQFYRQYDQPTFSVQVSIDT